MSETYGLKYQDRNGKVRVREFTSSAEREAWANRATERGTADAILAWSDPRVANPESGEAKLPAMTAEGHPVTEFTLSQLHESDRTPERVEYLYQRGQLTTVERDNFFAKLRAEREAAQYGSAEVAESLRDTILQLVDVTDGPLPVIKDHRKVATVSDVSTEDIDVCGHMADFEVQTSDGRTFRVRVSETSRG